MSAGLWPGSIAWPSRRRLSNSSCGISGCELMCSTATGAALVISFAPSNTGCGLTQYSPQPQSDRVWGQGAYVGRQDSRCQSASEVTAESACQAHVWVRTSGGPDREWRTGTAHILDDDDPSERQRIVGRSNLGRELCIAASGAMSTSLLTIRIDLELQRAAGSSTLACPK